MNEVVIGIGSNIDAEFNIEKALEILDILVRIEKVSSFIKTKPVGITDQPDFTNGAVRVKTDYGAKELKKKLKGIEDQLGRDRSAAKFGPRCIDLDIIVWNGEIVDRDYYTRDFLRQNVSEVISIAAQSGY